MIKIFTLDKMEYPELKEGETASLYARVRCICGKAKWARTVGAAVFCKCGLALGVDTTDSGFLPFVEGDLENATYKHETPKIIGWKWEKDK